MQFSETRIIQFDVGSRNEVCGRGIKQPGEWRRAGHKQQLHVHFQVDLWLATGAQQKFHGEPAAARRSVQVFGLVSSAR